MTLREQIAERLASVLMMGNGAVSGDVVRRPGTTLSFSTPGDPERFPEADFIDLGPVADECIRQMEWARRSSVNPGYVIKLAHHLVPLDHATGERLPLTAAPEDWTPPTPEER